VDINIADPAGVASRTHAQVLPLDDGVQDASVRELRGGRAGLEANGAVGAGLDGALIDIVEAVHSTVAQVARTSVRVATLRTHSTVVARVHCALVNVVLTVVTAKSNVARTVVVVDSVVAQAGVLAW
jgi:hypothetical protein